jgi:glycosyltransferase involved in cell wall biosynthesis
VPRSDVDSVATVTRDQAGGRPTIHLAVYTDATAWGGAEVVLGTLLESLGPHVCVVVLGSDQALISRLASCREGASALQLPRMSTKRDIREMWRFRRSLVRLRPDILQLNLQVPSASRFAVAVAVTIPRLRVIVVEHLAMPIASTFGRWLKRVTSRRLAAHVAVGERAARDVEAVAALPAGSVGTVRNGVRAPAGPRGPATGQRPPIIGTIARLGEQKGIDDLLRAAAQLPDARIVVVGDGPLRQNLAELADALGVGDRITWTGWVDDPAALLATFDIFVLPSRFEGLPLVILEAMLAAVPVVATDVGSVAEAIDDGRTGLLVPASDPAALAAAIRRLLDDPVAARRLADAARQVAGEHFTASAMADRYDALYEQVLSR